MYHSMIYIVYMAKIFRLKKGQLEFTSNGIIIEDKYRKGIYLRILMSTLWMIYGVFSYVRFLHTGDKFMLWSGIIIGGLQFIILITTLFFFSVKGEISREEIKKLSVKNIQGAKNLRIRLKNNRTRMVYQVQDPDNELESVVRAIQKPYKLL